MPRRGRLNGLIGAVLAGERRDGLLHYAGSVGTGWSETERARLAELLRSAAADHCPFTEVPPVDRARWALPRLVGEVRYSTRTRTGRLRNPLAPAAPRRRPRRPHLRRPRARRERTLRRPSYVPWCGLQHPQRVAGSVQSIQRMCATW
ncbi:ATP dependent DNA ligase [Streptomyces anulatus]|uniref:ATP dependent DNA ligase n=1 Tax=Streptomyces anulatus TaxID=1892 RepID=UPI0036DC410F